MSRVAISFTRCSNFCHDHKLGGHVAFLEDYEMHMAKYLVQGVDIWLNTPRFPMEASGTSGMKAALNGVLNFSVLDGWWNEGLQRRQRMGHSTAERQGGRAGPGPS